MIAALMLLLVTATAAPDASMFVGPPQGQPLAGAALDAKTQEVASLLRCPVCQGMSVADSPSEMAVNMKHQVNDLLARGYTREQILDYFERSYGQFVLLKPKFQGVNTLVWVLPILAIAIGVVIVLRVINRRVLSGAPLSSAAPAPVGTPAPHRVMTWVALAAAVVAVGAWYVVQPKPAPPEPQPVAVDPVKQLEATIQKSPDNLAARVELAKLYFDRNNLMGVFEQTQYVLERSPDDSRAMTYQAFVRIAMGQRENAVKLLSKATALDPGLTDAWIAMAWIKTQDGLPVEAQAAIAEAARRHPEERARLERVYADMTRTQ
jgi:cytochrome c-type biogenesis protein CcmH